MQGAAAPAFRPCTRIDGLDAWACHVVIVLVAILLACIVAAVLWACIVVVLIWRILTHRRTGIYMLDFACFAPPHEYAMRSRKTSGWHSCQAAW